MVRISRQIIGIGYWKVHCRITAASAQSSWKVSVSGTIRSFNDIVLIDQLWLDDICFFHMVDSFSSFPAVGLVHSKSIVLASLQSRIHGLLNSELVLLHKATFLSHFLEFICFQTNIKSRPPLFRHDAIARTCWNLNKVSADPYVSGSEVQVLTIISCCLLCLLLGHRTMFMGLIPHHAYSSLRGTSNRSMVREYHLKHRRSFSMPTVTWLLSVNPNWC